MKVAVILPAAGLGTRMGRTSAETAGTSRKQLMQLEGSPILLHTARKFAASPEVQQIIVALKSQIESIGGIGHLPDVINALGDNVLTNLTIGDAEALYSLVNGVNPARKRSPNAMSPAQARALIIAARSQF